MTPEALFFAIAMCSLQPDLSSKACNVLSQAIFEGYNGQKVLDKANELYLEPLPKEVKAAGTLGVVYHQQKFKVGLYRGLALEMHFVRTRNIDEDISYQYLSYHTTFP